MAEAQLPQTKLPQANYLEYAFKDQHNLVVLFGASCFSLAFASPAPLLVSAAGELLWLLVGPRLSAFRGWVDRQRSAQYLARSEAAIEGALRELDGHDANRYRILARHATELVSRAERRLSAAQLDLARHALLELRRTFLDYSFLSQRVEALREGTPQSDMEKQLAELQESYSAERELTVRMTIRKAQSSLQRRIDQQTALRSLHRTIELRLEMLEQAVPLLEGRLADPTLELLAPEVEGALTEIGSADALERAVDEVFEHEATRSAQ
jgi:hypothetical protein